MLRPAALLLLAAATPAAAQSAGDTARREIERTLEGVRAPMFGAGQTLPGVTGSYAVTMAGCRTDVAIALPAHGHSGASFPARTEQVKIEWGKTQSIKTAKAYVVIAAPGLPAGGRYFYAGSEAGAARLKAQMDTLAGACFGPAANTAPTQVPVVSERVPEKPDSRGTPQCRFRAIPELLLTDNRPPVVKIATYKIAPREGGEKSYLRFGAQSGEQIANWDGILAEPQIVLDSAAHRDVQVTRAVVLVDGRPIAVPIAPSHATAYYEKGKFATTVSVNPTSYNPGGLLAALASGSTVIVRLSAGNREVSQFTFDVRRLRLAPAALKGARWTCK